MPTMRSMDAAAGALLSVSNPRIGFGAGPKVVDGVDLVLHSGRLLCLVGESGSGKSLIALSLMKLLPQAANATADRFEFNEQDLTAADDDIMNAIRGNRTAKVFQEPMTPADARTAVLAMFCQVQIPIPEARLSAYPHQLSGGMHQRVMIAMALVCRPALLIADEPTTALDVTIQSQILRLIDVLRGELGAAVLFITHNLAIVAESADDVAVIYAGRAVERAPKAALFGNPMHPYTLALFAALPRKEDRGRRLAAIDGQVPAVGAKPPGCRFAPRCPFAKLQCRAFYPPLRAVGPGHFMSCWRAPLEDHVA